MGGAASTPQAVGWAIDPTRRWFACWPDTTRGRCAHLRYPAANGQALVLRWLFGSNPRHRMTKLLARCALRRWLRDSARVVRILDTRLDQRIGRIVGCARWLQRVASELTPCRPHGAGGRRVTG
jgi:hypothetical protein